MKKKLNIVFVIAGSEPLGSAGMQADIKAITACGGYAACALTGIVDEDTQRVKSIFHLPTDLIVSQAESFLGDVGAQCIKTGVLPNADIIYGVAGVLARYPKAKKVIDPVIVNSVGEKLVSDDAIEAYKTQLFPLATIITPNRREAEVLLGHPITNIKEDIKELGRYGCSVVIKSLPTDEEGNLLKSKIRKVEELRSIGSGDTVTDTGFLDEGSYLTDCLYNAETGIVRRFTKPRIQTHNVNGTGDSFGSAIATYLAKGYTLPEAVRYGEEFINKAIALGAEYEFGHGFGPVHPCFMEDKVMHERIYD